MLGRALQRLKEKQPEEQQQQQQQWVVWWAVLVLAAANVMHITCVWWMERRALCALSQASAHLFLSNNSTINKLLRVWGLALNGGGGSCTKAHGIFLLPRSQHQLPPSSIAGGAAFHRGGRKKCRQ